MAPTCRQHTHIVHIDSPLPLRSCASAYSCWLKAPCIPQHLCVCALPACAVPPHLLPFLQLLIGFARPPGNKYMKLRYAWDIAHAILGNVSVALGILNVILGVFIFLSKHQGERPEQHSPATPGAGEVW